MLFVEPHVPGMMNQRVGGYDPGHPGSSHSMYLPHTYGQPPIPPMFHMKQQPMGGEQVAKPPVSMYNAPPLDMMTTNQNLNRSLTSGYNLEPMNNLTEKFNHSMNIGHDFKNKVGLGPMMAGFPSFPPQSSMMMGQLGAGYNGGGQLNQTQPCFYPMNSQIDVNNVKPQPSTPSKQKEPEGAKETKKGDLEKPHSATETSEVSKPKEGKSTLKPGARSFKPASAKPTSNSFYQSQPKVYQSYLHASPPPQDLLHQSTSGHYNEPPMSSQMNSTFSGTLPSMIPPPFLPSMIPHSPLPTSSALNPVYAKPPAPAPYNPGVQMTGRLKYFKEDDNYGFIVSDIDGENIFFHYSEMKSQSISKEALAQAKDKYIIRLVFQVVKYVGKYKLSKKAVNIFVTEFSEISKQGPNTTALGM